MLREDAHYDLLRAGIPSWQHLVIPKSLHRISPQPHRPLRRGLAKSLERTILQTGVIHSQMASLSINDWLALAARQRSTLSRLAETSLQRPQQTGCSPRLPRPQHRHSTAQSAWILASTRCVIISLASSPRNRAIVRIVVCVTMISKL